jgi:hypothetical protein
MSIPDGWKPEWPSYNSINSIKYPDEGGCGYVLHEFAEGGWTGICLRISKITDTQIHVECPFCSVYTKKDGTPRVHPKRTFHYHGRAGQPSVIGSWDHRSDHCNNEGRARHPNGTLPYFLYATEKTEGVNA